ncbi:putative phosphatidylinositol [Sesbania bispinosa]|nr:putative phosphatidylinositol [Sesbania bispinosa]
MTKEKDNKRKAKENTILHFHKAIMGTSGQPKNVTGVSTQLQMYKGRKEERTNPTQKN